MTSRTPILHSFLSTTTMRLTLLICDDVIPPIKVVHGNYGPIFKQLLSSSLAQITLGGRFLQRYRGGL